MHKSEKGDNSAKYSQNLWKVNQVIYTLVTICVSNIMILAQAVLCWQGLFGLNALSLKREIIQSNIHRILRKVNQVIYIVYLKCMIDVIILAKAVLQMFCWQDCFTIRNTKVGKGSEFSQIFIEFCQKLIRSTTPWTQSVSHISWS